MRRVGKVDHRASLFRVFGRRLTAPACAGFIYRYAITAQSGLGLFGPEPMRSRARPRARTSGTKREFSPERLKGRKPPHCRRSGRNVSSARAITFIKLEVDPLNCRLDLAPVACTPGAFQYLAHLSQSADERGNEWQWRGGHPDALPRDRRR